MTCVTSVLFFVFPKILCNNGNSNNYIKSQILCCGTRPGGAPTHLQLRVDHELRTATNVHASGLTFSLINFITGNVRVIWNNIVCIMLLASSNTSVYEGVFLT